MQTTIDKYHLKVAIETQECRIPEDVRSAIQPQIDRIGQAVRQFPESELYVTVVYHPKSNAYHAQAKLRVPGETVITGARDGYIDVAIRHCLDKVGRRAERLEPDDEAVEEARRDIDLSAPDIAPTDLDSGTLGPAVLEDNYREFRRALLGQEEPLRKRVGRWVQRYPQVDELVGVEFEIADLVEEVFLLAFEGYADRPKHLSRHEWLDSLIDPAVKSFWADPESREAVKFAQTLTDRPPSDLDVNPFSQ
jgi:ribosome-associated translation inhibitor RaiA